MHSCHKPNITLLFPSCRYPLASKSLKSVNFLFCSNTPHCLAMWEQKFPTKYSTQAQRKGFSWLHSEWLASSGLTKEILKTCLLGILQSYYRMACSFPWSKSLSGNQGTFGKHLFLSMTVSSLWFMNGMTPVPQCKCIFVFFHLHMHSGTFQTSLLPLCFPCCHYVSFSSSFSLLLWMFFILGTKSEQMLKMAFGSASSLPEVCLWFCTMFDSVLHFYLFLLYI